MQKGAQGRGQKDCKVKNVYAKTTMFKITVWMVSPWNHLAYATLEGRDSQNFPSCIASMRNGEVISTWLGDLSGLTNYERWQILTPVAHQTARASPGPTRSSKRRLLCSASPGYFQLQPKKNDLPMCNPKISHCLRVCVL